MLTRRVMAYGHRGALALAPENTLAGFRLALDLGADGIELDVHLTADGQVVVLHDEHVARTTDGRGRVRDLTLAQLRRLVAATRWGGEFRGERIPTLGDALAVVAGRGRAQIELKRASPEAITPAIEIVRRAGLQAHCAFVSFSPGLLAAARRAAPEIETELIVVLPVAQAARAAAAGARSLALPEIFVTRRSVRLAHEAGLRVSAGITNHESRMRELVNAGVDALYSDRPDVLVALLRELGSK